VLTLKRREGLAIFVLVAGVVTAMACGGGGSGGSSATGVTSPSVTPGTGATAVAADVTITINGMNAGQSFSPNPGAVKAGQTVAWHNADGIAHTATGASFDTGLIQAGATSAPISFAVAGNLAYHCNVHPSMVGTLTVSP
jgi:plastocyanin